jgi:hypothetical protein
MDLQTLELRLLGFVKVFTQSEGEGKLIRKFVTSFFLGDELGGDDPSLMRISAISSSLSTFSKHHSIQLAALEERSASPSSSDEDVVPLVHPSPLINQETLIVLRARASRPEPPSYSRFPKLGSVVPMKSSAKVLVPASPSWGSALLVDTSSRAAIVKSMDGDDQIYPSAELFVLKKCFELKSIFSFDGLLSPVTFKHDDRQAQRSQ